jgi:transcriptional regulator with PAS, ATPase and Fis domain
MMVLGDAIDAKDLPDYLRAGSWDRPLQSPGAHDSGSFESTKNASSPEALSRAEGNQSKAARELQIGRDALRYKMKKQGLL